ncbi:MAG TPA: complex I NDUFA9 subunit family protein, partial [Nitrospiraceae bacterium]|nr:complex I NDUFA9 subunit family protein [Nitrospiraceae bacterium]
TGDAHLNEIYEIGGPEQLTYEEVTKAIARAMGIWRPKVNVPMLFMKPMARVLEAVLPNPPVTTDQLIMLEEDNVCSLQDIRDAFGIEPVLFREGLQRFIKDATA